MKVAYIVGFWPDYEEFTFSVSLRPEFDLKVVNLKRTLEPTGLGRGLRRRFLRWRYRLDLRERLKTGTDAIYLFQDNIRLLQILQQMGAQFRGGILARDPVAASAKRAALLLDLAGRGVAVWSFDPLDCARYGFHHYRQFVRRDPAAADVWIESDLFFVGRDKGRASTLRDIDTCAKAADLVTDFTVLAPGDHLLPYREYLRRMLRSRCLVEVNQQGQSGSTMRAVEALLYGKKLLSNNPNHRKLLGYSESQVLIFEKPPPADVLCAFLDQPAAVPSDALLAQYEASYVLRGILREALMLPSRTSCVGRNESF